MNPTDVTHPHVMSIAMLGITRLHEWIAMFRLFTGIWIERLESKLECGFSRFLRDQNVRLAG